MLFATAAPASAARLQVTVEGLRNADGMVAVCVFDSAAAFPDCAGLPGAMGQRQAASVGALRFDFDVPPGLHAVSVLHDENGNGRMDTNFIGIPREGGGVSNNPPPRRGPPRYGEAEFRLDPAGGAIVVKMIYP